MTIETHIGSGARVAKGASYLFIQGAMTNVLSFLFLTIAAHLLSVSDIGAISALGITGTLFITIGTLAIPSASIKFISEYVGKNKLATVKRIYTKTMQFGFLTSTLVSLTCVALSATISQLVFQDSSFQSVIIVLGFDVGLSILNSLLNGTLFGLQRFRQIALVGVAVSILRLLIPIILLITGFGIFGVVSAWVIADLIGVSTLLFLTSTSLGKEGNSSEFSFQEMLRYALPLYAASILAYFSITIDKLVILSLSNLSVLGIYSVAIAAVNAIGIVSSSIGSSLFPQMAQMQGRYGVDALKQASVKASRYVFIIFTPIAIGLATVAYPTLQLFFGGSYASGWAPLAIVSIAVALTSASIVVNNLLLSLGMTRTILMANVIGVIMGAVLSATLVSSLGSVGAALGRTSLIFASFTIAAYTLKKTHGLRLDIDTLKKCLISSSVMVIAVVALELLVGNKYVLPFFVVTGAVIYVLMLKFLRAVNNHDIQLLREIMPKRAHGLVNFLEFFFR